MWNRADPHPACGIANEERLAQRHQDEPLCDSAAQVPFLDGYLVALGRLPLVWHTITPLSVTLTVTISAPGVLAQRNLRFRRRAMPACLAPSPGRLLLVYYLFNNRRLAGGLSLHTSTTLGVGAKQSEIPAR